MDSGYWCVDMYSGWSSGVLECGTGGASVDNIHEILSYLWDWQSGYERQYYIRIMLL